MTRIVGCFSLRSDRDHRDSGREGDSVTKKVRLRGKGGWIKVGELSVERVTPVRQIKFWVLTTVEMSMQKSWFIFRGGFVRVADCEIRVSLLQNNPAVLRSRLSLNDACCGRTQICSLLVGVNG